MSVSYKAISWNKFKKHYDKILWIAILIYSVAFVGLQFGFYPNITMETLIMRLTATLAFFLLHVILIIGPLCRISPSFLPLLYNRRHLGVSMFLIALIHAGLSLVQHHGGGDLPPLVSLFISNPSYGSLTHFPFEIFGFFALLILAGMAVTSHDFWLNNLTPRIWKSLHMLVYVAYLLLVFHVLFGFLQEETELVYVIIVAVGFITVAGLHIISATTKKAKKKHEIQMNWVKVPDPFNIEDGRAILIETNKQEIAVFRSDDEFFAVHNRCKHQMGPLSEGVILDGCITCPWHGFQYKPEDGTSPPPFEEKIATYNLKVENGELWVQIEPNLSGVERPSVILKKNA